MSPDDLYALRSGDLIASALTHVLYVVTGQYGNHVTAVCSVDVTNSAEWLLIAKARYGLAALPQEGR